MIKVIKEGTIPVQEIECDYCHSVLSYNPYTDVDYNRVRGINGCLLKIANATLTCPICENKIKIEDQKVIKMLEKTSERDSNVLW